MSASASRPASRSQDGASPGPRLLPDAIVMASYAALLVLGFVAGIVAGIAQGWLAWLSQTGTAGTVVAVSGLVAFLLLLFLACRLAGRELGRPGAGFPAAGWVAASFALIGWSSGGDVVLTSATINYGFVFGGIAAVVVATVLTPPRG
ncbi:DUF6113 family protein [Marinactinospora thermotolerans]|uniref:Uncharacterized protein n=1 Tax=Marinactinospora thermotolerans DSM 45154 TaxID=1122192 RepID=A0A1T4SX85_9ACTN|nr:hypothetical protein [Marinactinospora thermotolerans]SKA32787.1 hypothetical protein SAMN02745673_04084 [Marinactinospora thermotolerans DSM 45154]